MTRRIVIACLVAAGAQAAAPAGAQAGHAAFEQVSLGAVGGNETTPTQFAGASDDGTRVILMTEEQLAASDTDVNFDLYERAGGVTTHLSIGPSGGNSAGGLPRLAGMSADGKRVFFEIAENLVPQDTDECNPDDPGVNPCADVYESSAGTTTLISAGNGGNADFGADFAGASEDGTRVFFTTDEPLTAADTDTEVDLYQRAGGTTTLVSTGPAGGNGSFGVLFRDASADGTRVFISTSESLTSQDTDSAADVYERAGGTTTLVSTGPAGGNGTARSRFAGAPEDGTRVFFDTTERLTAQDTDSSLDVYERAGGATALVSTGPAGGNGAPDAGFKAASETGTRVLFETAERLTAADTDGATDIYERSGGTTTLVSVGNGSGDAFFQGASADATRVVFSTTDQLVAADTDSMTDLYERAAGTTSLVSTAPGGGNGAFDVFFSAISEDGRRVFFQTLEPLVSDSDSLPDVYERANGATTRLSTGTGGGNGNFIAVFLGASVDGSRVFFNSAETLASTDGDTATDVFVARTTDTYVRPKGASPFSVPLVVAYRPCTAPNRTHAPPGLAGEGASPSCFPPVQASQHLTVGTFDANQRSPRSTGKLRFSVQSGTPSTPADEADVSIHFELHDVLVQGTLADYTGELGISLDVRITDRENGSVATDPATVATMPFPLVAGCVATGDTSGGTCSLDTSIDAVVPGAIKEGFRSMWALGAVSVSDGGSDGVVGTAPNTLFAVPGIFIP